MNPASMLIYLCKVNLAITLLFAGYYLLLRNEKFFEVNRWILMTIIILPFLLPLLPSMPITGLQGLQRWQERVVSRYHLFGDPVIRNPVPSTADERAGLMQKGQAWHSGQADRAGSGYEAIGLLMDLYFFITGLLLIRYIGRILQVSSLIRRSRRSKREGIWYCEHEDEWTAFSFFRFLVINESAYDPGHLKQILIHERVHIRQAHTLDLQLSEIVHALLWMNPIAKMVKKTLQLNLEFIADEKVLETGVDRKTYQWSLLENSLGRGFKITHAFHTPKIKDRIRMMDADRSPLRHLYKYAIVLFLLLSTSGMVSAPVNPVPKNAAPVWKELEGIYSLDGKREVFLQIRSTGSKLILKQHWDGQEIVFTPKSTMDFICKERKGFPLRFSRDAAGEVTHLLACDRDDWVKVQDARAADVSKGGKGVQPNESVATDLSMKDRQSKKKYLMAPTQLRAFEGIYKMKLTDGPDAGKEIFLQCRAEGDGLVLEQQWDGREIALTPSSPVDFFSTAKGPFECSFSYDEDGAVREALILHHDRWVKVQG